MFSEAFRWHVTGMKYVSAENKMELLAKYCHSNIFKKYFHCLLDKF